MAVAAAVLGDPAGEEFLEAGEGAGGEHLDAEGVLFEGGDVGLVVIRISHCVQCCHTVS